MFPDELIFLPWPVKVAHGAVFRKEMGEDISDGQPIH